MLEVSELYVSYGNVLALHGASLSVGTGEAVAVIGSNGAGKSTLLRTISGLMRPRAGTISYDGIDITRASTDRIVSLGVSQCPEGRRIFGRLSVRENLVLGGIQRPASDVDADIRQIGDLFPRLAERLDQSGGTLSGGEQQMLAIGRALMAKPRLLILDEPSLGLAPIMVERIFEVIEQLKRQGLTILLVEQNVHHALDLADRAYVMESGSHHPRGSGRRPAPRLARGGRLPGFPGVTQYWYPTAHQRPQRGQPLRADGSRPGAHLRHPEAHQLRSRRRHDGRRVHRRVQPCLRHALAGRHRDHARRAPSSSGCSWSASRIARCGAAPRWPSC